MDACLIIGNNYDLSKFDFNNKIICAIDKGCKVCMENGIKIDYAIGDFDSYSHDIIAKNVIRLNPIKDDTDTHFAVHYFKNCENIYILGGISGARCEHFIANLLLYFKYDNLIFIDNNSYIYLAKNNEKIFKDEYKFISLFALEKVEGLTLKGFKYNLDSFILDPSNPLGVSNEIINEFGSINFIKGKLLIIKSKED